MKSKTKYLKKNNDFKKIITKSKPTFNFCFQLWSKYDNNKTPLIGIVVSKKNFKKAVQRNKIKRQIKAMIRDFEFDNKTYIVKVNSKYNWKKYELNKSKLLETLNKVKNVKKTSNII